MFFRLKKENKVIKNILIRNISNVFEHEVERNYYRLIKGSNFWSNNYIEYESSGNTDKTLLFKQYLRPHLEYIINNLKKSETWKIELTIAIHFVYSKYNDEERVMYSKSENVEMVINNKAGEVLKNF